MSTPLSRRTALRSAAVVVGVGAAGVAASCSGSPTGGEATSRPHGRWRGAPTDRPRRHEVTPGAADRAGALDPGADGGDAAATLAASRALLEAASVVGGDVRATRTTWRPARRRRRGSASRCSSPGPTSARARPVGHPHRGPLVAVPAEVSGTGSREVVDGSDADALADAARPPSAPARGRCHGAGPREGQGAGQPRRDAGGRRRAAGAVGGTDPRTAADALAAVREVAGRRGARRRPRLRPRRPVRPAGAHRPPRPRAARRRVAALPGAPDGRAVRPPADRVARDARRAVGRPGGAAGHGAGRAVRRPHEDARGAGLRAHRDGGRRGRARRTAPTRGARRCAPCCRGCRPPSGPASTSCSTSSRAATTSSPRPRPTRSCSGGRGSGSRSTRSGACSPTRSPCARSVTSASTRSTRSVRGWPSSCDGTTCRPRC